LKPTASRRQGAVNAAPYSLLGGPFFDSGSVGGAALWATIEAAADAARPAGCGKQGWMRFPALTPASECRSKRIPDDPMGWTLTGCASGA